MTTKTKPCYACETGTVRLTNLRGRKFDYRDERDLEFDVDFEAPVCDICGEMYLKGALTEQFSGELERLRRARKCASAQRFVQAVESQFPSIPRSVWEDTLGLSHGYLSRLASGARVADTPLAILLEGFTKEPQIVLRLVSVAGRMPEELMPLMADQSGGAARARAR